MTITLTKEEIEKFANDLGEWHGKKAAYVLQNFMKNIDRLSFSQQPKHEFDRLIADFEKDNPKPNWRNYL